MITEGWEPISTVEEGVRVFAYRVDHKQVSVTTFTAKSMKWIREGNPNFAYTHWQRIPERWGLLPKFPKELHINVAMSMHELMQTLEDWEDNS